MGDQFHNAIPIIFAGWIRVELGCSWGSPEIRPWRFELAILNRLMNGISRSIWLICELIRDWSHQLVDKCNRLKIQEPISQNIKVNQRAEMYVAPVFSRTQLKIRDRHSTTRWQHIFSHMNLLRGIPLRKVFGDCVARSKDHWHFLDPMSLVIQETPRTVGWVLGRCGHVLCSPTRLALGF